MHMKTVSLRRWLQRYTPLLAALLVLLSGSLLVLLMARNVLLEEGQASARLVHDRLKSTLDSFALQSMPSLQRVALHCPAFIYNARLLALHNPYIRSISLGDADGRTIRCSTITGSKPQPLPPRQTSLRFLYLPNSPLVPNTSVLVLQLPLAGKQLYFGINRLLLNAIFPTRSEYLETYVTLGRYKLNAVAVLDDKPRIHHTVATNPYFSVGFAYTWSSFIRYVVYHYLAYWLLVVVLAVLVFQLLVRLLASEARLCGKISQGLARGQFHAFIQPVFTREGVLSGGEVLIRWIHPKDGFIPPDVFIKAAEHSGQINKLFSVLVQQLLATLGRPGVRLPIGFHLGLNISAPQLAQPALLTDCHALMAMLAPQQGVLVLELTERVEIPDNAACYGVLNQLKSEGARIAIDDFGTGHSSLIYLTRMQVDCLKIDKSFVDLIAEGSRTDIVDNVIDLARRLGMITVAEGVETAYQQAYLQQMGVDMLQGYYFARPMPLADFVRQYLPQRPA